MKSASGYNKVPVVVVDGKALGGSDDIRAMCQTGYFQYKLEKAGVQHRIPGMKWLKEMYQ